MEDKIIKAKLLYLVEEAQKLAVQSGLEFFSICANPKEIKVQLPVDFIKANFDIDKLKVGNRITEYSKQYDKNIKIFSWECAPFKQDDIKEILEYMAEIPNDKYTSQITKWVLFDNYNQALNEICANEFIAADAYDFSIIGQVKKEIGYID